MKILLTGRNGQIGWELQRTLAPLGEVAAFDRAGIDLCDPDAIREAIRSVQPRVIVNAAAYTAVDQAESEPDIAMSINAIAPGVMAEEAKRLGALLIHYSTDYVFDGTQQAPYVETDLPNPLSAYGRSKLAGEDAICDAGCKHLILRTSWVYGARGKNFLLTMLRLAKERDSLRIVDDQFGAPTWSRMIAEATALILAQLRFPQPELLPSDARPRPPEQVPEQGWGAGGSGIFQLTASGSTNWYGFAAEIFRLAAEHQLFRAPRVEPIPSEAFPLPGARPKNSRLSNDKLFSAFGIALPAWQAQLPMCMLDVRNTAH